MTGSRDTTWARMLAEVTSQILARGNGCLSEHKGLYHLAGSGFASRLEWAKEILRLDLKSLEQVTKELLPVPTAEFQTPARRPLFSAMDCAKFKHFWPIVSRLEADSYACYAEVILDTTAS